MEKIGVIDLGSNSARLVVVNVLEGGYFVIVDELKESVRLGQDMERDGFLKPSRVQETIKTLKMFKRLCDAYKIEKIVAVATAAVRRAKNQRSFLDEVYSLTGIKLRVLSAEEEANYVYQGVINSMDIPKGLIMEIGGGSTKLVLYNRRNILAYETLPFGAVTLTELFSNDGLTPNQQTEKVEEFFVEQLKQLEWLKDIDPETQLVGVGGSFRNLCKISKMVRKYPIDMIHNYNISVDEFGSIYEMIRVLDLDKKKKIKGLSSGRADILPSALACANAFIKFMGFNNLVIGGSGLREGLMFNYAVPSTLEKPIGDVLGHSLLTMVKYFESDEKHVTQVVNLSIMLFKELRVLHKYSRHYLKILKVAATLHDSGNRIKYYNHQKHSGYIIMNSNLYGLSHREIILAGLVAHAQKKDDIPMNEFMKYKDLITEEDIEAVKKLGCILKIAESFDRSMANVIIGISCDVLGDSVIMKTELNGDASLEIKDALSHSSEFRRSFRKNLEII